MNTVEQCDQCANIPRFHRLDPDKKYPQTFQVVDSYLGYEICCYNEIHFRCHELSLYGYNSITELKRDMREIRTGRRTKLMLERAGIPSQA